ncbi:hypothetical protein BJ742DRAFT_735870 [Cladochytrium replicatum]|nr:hypothetical protein BJ742DRAFT_735870 [Cladochytrium replicatum]
MEPELASNHPNPTGTFRRQEEIKRLMRKRYRLPPGSPKDHRRERDRHPIQQQMRIGAQRWVREDFSEGIEMLKEQMEKQPPAKLSLLERFERAQVLLDDLGVGLSFAVNHFSHQATTTYDSPATTEFGIASRSGIPACRRSPLSRSFASSDQQPPTPPPRQERKWFKRDDDWSYNPATDPMSKLSEEEIAQLKRELAEEQRKLHIGTYAIIGGGLLAVGVTAWVVVTFVPKKSSVESS